MSSVGPVVIVFQSCRAGSVCLFCSGPTAPSASCHSGLWLRSCPWHVGIQHQLQAAYRYLYGIFEFLLTEALLMSYYILRVVISVHKEFNSQLVGKPIADTSIEGYLLSNALKRAGKVVLGFTVCKKYSMIEST